MLRLRTYSLMQGLQDAPLSFIRALQEEHKKTFLKMYLPYALQFVFS